MVLSQSNLPGRLTSVLRPQRRGYPVSKPANYLAQFASVTSSSIAQPPPRLGGVEDVTIRRGNDRFIIRPHPWQSLNLKVQLTVRRKNSPELIELLSVLLVEFLHRFVDLHVIKYTFLASSLRLQENRGFLYWTSYLDLRIFWRMRIGFCIVLLRLVVLGYRPYICKIHENTKIGFRDELKIIKRRQIRHHSENCWNPRDVM